MDHINVPSDSRPGLDDAEPAPAPAEGGAAAPKKRGPKKGKKGAAEPDESSPAALKEFQRFL